MAGDKRDREREELQQKLELYGGFKFTTSTLVQNKSTT